jgi:chromosome segregation ATPase
MDITIDTLNKAVNTLSDVVKWDQTQINELSKQVAQLKMTLEARDKQIETMKTASTEKDKTVVSQSRRITELMKEIESLTAAKSVQQYTDQKQQVPPQFQHWQTPWGSQYRHN